MSGQGRAGRSAPGAAWLLGLLAFLVTGLGPREVRAQEGPNETERPPPARRFALGLRGFGARLGWDIGGDEDVVFGYTIDGGNVFGSRFRLRPSFEVGVGGPEVTYVGSVEGIVRFTSDREVAVPYVGGGIGVEANAACASDPACPALWLQFALGFEVAVAPSFGWQVEYHAEDAFGRHRLFVGLVTRRGR